MVGVLVGGTVRKAAEKLPKHVRCDNCWGYGVKTDVCTQHERPRGECDECPRCPACDDADAKDAARRSEEAEHTRREAIGAAIVRGVWGSR